jgi:NDP-sugar pyrophosphorylase family protein
MENKVSLKKIIAIMPMAGRGERFKKFGYVAPKPLIDISGEPMYLKSAKTFPKSVKWVLILQKQLSKNSFFLKSLNFFKKKKLILLKKVTKGQAATVLKSLKYLQKDAIVIIHSCDLQFSVKMSEIYKKIKKNDIIVFTAKGKKFHHQNSNQFSWVRKNFSSKQKNIEISCKKNFSSNKKKNRVLVGSFIFKNKNILKNSIQHIFKNKLKIKNEYYIDMAAKVSPKIGYRVEEIIVKNYKSWGSHEELLNYKNK